MTDRQKEVWFAVLLIAVLVGLLLGGLLVLRLTGREARWQDGSVSRCVTCWPPQEC